MSLCAIIQNNPVPALITYPRKPDNPIIVCNEAFVQMSGYSRDEIIGRSCFFLSGEGTEPEARASLQDGIARGEPVMIDMLNYRKDGTPFRNAVMMAPVFDDVGDLEFYIGSQVEVPANGARNGSADPAIAHARMAGLSPRQHEVLVRMARGQSNKQMAYDLGLSERTIKMHRSALLRALGSKSSVEAIRVAIEAGL